MAIPFEPDRSGVLMLGRHTTTIDEVEAVLVTAIPSPRRRTIFDQWVELLNAIADIAPMVGHWFDGSFVTAKQDPDDIDVLSWLDSASYDSLDGEDQARVTALVSGDQNPSFPGCESWVQVAYPEEHELHGFYLKSCDAWHEVFGGEHDDAPKGYLELDESCLGTLGH